MKDWVMPSSTSGGHGGGTGEFRQPGLSFTVLDINGACEAVVRERGSVRSGPEDRGDEGINPARRPQTDKWKGL